VLIELYIFAFAIISYGFLITLAIIGFNKLNRTIASYKNSSTSYISIVVSARNEEQTIRDFIYEIVKQNFSRENFELIIIDDCSDDKTYEFAKETLEKSDLQYQLIRQDNHCGKKKILH
jgi:cellulose synthase/poly-beta-1,6-N-acetylglucosamine synthase-like glycosyltransferase